MITLEVADLVIIVSHTLHLDTDRVLDLLDPTAAEAALAQARSGADDDEPASQAAWLLHALVRQRPLRRGNQQVALVAMLQLLALIGRGQTMPSGHIPFTPRAKKVLELSLREALQLGHSYIGTEHILLGLIREGKGVAAQVLTGLGADTRVRQVVTGLLAARVEQAGAGERAETRAPFTYGLGYPRGRPSGVPRLLRVVPIAREVDVGDGQQLVVLSLEIWSDWLDLRLALVSSRAAEAAQAQRLPAGYGQWTLSDDLDTAYRALGTASGGSELFNVAQASFTPSPPPEASTLTLTLAGAEDRDEIQVVVELK